MAGDKQPEQQQQKKSPIPEGADASALRNALLSHVSSVGNEMKPKLSREDSAANKAPARPPMMRDPSALPTPFPEGASTVDYMSAGAQQQNRPTGPQDKSSTPAASMSKSPSHQQHQSSSGPTQQHGFHTGTSTGTSSPGESNPLLFPLTSPPSPQLHARKSFGSQTGAHPFNLSGMSQVISSSSSPGGPGTPRTPGSEAETPASSTSSSRRNSMHASLSRNPSFKSPGTIVSKPDFKGAFLCERLSSS